MDRLLPIVPKSSTDKVLPTSTTDDILNPLPRRLKQHKEKELPRWKAQSADIGCRTRVMHVRAQTFGASSTDTPLINALLPRRAVMRNDTELPKAVQPRVESLFPSLARLYAEKTLPALNADQMSRIPLIIGRQTHEESQSTTYSFKRHKFVLRK
jgi:hypothetical protein